MRRIRRAFLGLLAAGRSAFAVESLVDLGYTKLQGAAEVIGITQWLGVPYAAAPLKELRFAAPIDPPPTTGIVEATQFKPICLPRSPSDFTMQPNKRFRVDEDCLYMNIFAPSNASESSKLPVMYFIQGGGFESNSNANFNASDLASFGNIVVVQINYRVGPFGFIQSQEIKNHGSLNIGLKDQVQGLNWLNSHITSFGGDPEHIVAVGDSAGATSILLLMMAFSKQDNALIKGAVMESASVATLRTLEQGQLQYNCLVNATGCSEMLDTLACLRSVPAASLLTENCQFNPHLDGEMVNESMLSAFASGSYLQIPTIIGSCTDEGTKSVPRDLNTTAQALSYLNNRVSNSLSNSSLALLAQTYLNTSQSAPTFPNSSPLWRPLANAAGDIGAHCVAADIQNAISNVSSQKTWNYRYAVLDPEDEANGFGAYHTVELNGVFGPNNTDGAPPVSYRTTNAAIVPLTMGYWTSFVKTLDPNTLRIPGAPEWDPWSGAQGADGRKRLRFQTNNTAVESMPDQQAMEIPPQKGTLVQLTRPSPGALAAAANAKGPGSESPNDVQPAIGAAGRAVLGWCFVVIQTLSLSFVLSLIL
ncbi:Alpha/Beta hydrolase protein [Xylariaceae sp. FL1651]|nr:Alpha/Beta hydrolase protein [Xylariaceae sp. FL1651]